MTYSVDTLLRLTGEAFAIALMAAPESEVYVTTNGFMALNGEPVPGGNMAGIWGGPAPEERLREFGTRLARRDLSGYLVTTVELSENLVPVAKECGFISHFRRIPLMVFEPDAYMPSRDDYTVETVTTETQRQEWADVCARAYGMPLDVADRGWGPLILDAPGLQIFLARKDGEVVSTVMTIGGGATDGIYSIGTLPDHRRQGAGIAVLAHAINTQRARGARLFYLHATAQGEPLYRKLGFQTVAELPAFVRGRSAPAAA